MSNVVMKISLPGYDVKTATPEQCAVHSSYPTFKSKIEQSPPHRGLLVVDFTSGITQNVTHTVYSIPHGYSYTPFTFPFIVATGNPFLGTPIVGLGYTAIGANFFVSAYADDNNFYVKVFDNFNWIDASSELRVSFSIFAENGS